MAENVQAFCQGHDDREINNMTEQSNYINKVQYVSKSIFESTKNPPKAFVVTYGCQQNESDSEKLKGMLKTMGYAFTQSLDEADLILFNTCAVRENAELKVFGNVGALVHYKRRKPSLLIGLCGCMMQQEHIVSQIKAKYRHVDMVFGTHALQRFPEILFRALTSNERVFDLLQDNGQIAENIPVLRGSDYKAWVSVMYGCNNFCSYCIVPYVRGREKSRSDEMILMEVRELAKQGIKDITLLGQNVNSYGKDLSSGITFPKLLEKINEIDGDFRVRFMTSHPKDATDELFEAMSSCDKVAPHLHLPVQAGNNRILKRMNRGYTKEEYLLKIESLRQKNPKIVLTSDIIVGFPTESYEEFLDTIDVIKQVRFDSLFTFLYSKRTGTLAATMEGQVDKKEMHRRFDELLSVQNQISSEINKAAVGTIERVLVEGASKNNEKVQTGRTGGNKVVNFVCDPGYIGQFVSVKITQANTWSLFGEMIG